MKKSFLISLASCALVSSAAITVAGMSSCTTLKTNNDSNTETETDNAAYTTVTFKAPEGVTIEGSAVVKAKVGRQFATVPQPKATKEGQRFVHWSKTQGGLQPIPMDTIIEASGLEVWPVFEDQLKLEHCVGFAAIEPTTITVYNSSASAGDHPEILVSKNFGKTWASYETDYATGIEMAAGDNVFIKGDNMDNGFSTADHYTTFQFSTGSSVNVVGSVMGLLDGGEPIATEVIPDAYCFHNLFSGASAIKYISDTFLPSMTLTPHCYDSMFMGCTQLNLAPWLPATVIDTTNQEGCYNNLFNGCSSLTQIKIDYVNGFNETCFQNWVSGVTSQQGVGHFLYNGSSTQRGVSAIPANWAIHGQTTGIEISCSDPVAIEGYNYVVNHPYQFEATITPSTASQDVTWVSDNTTVASVNPETGVVTPLRTGAGKTCNIIAYAKDGSGKSGSKTINVTDINTSNCVILKSASNVDSTVSWDYVGAGIAPNFKYSNDNGVSWLKMWPGNVIDIKKGQSVYIKGDNPEGLSNSSASYAHFALTGSVSLSGTVMGLIDDGRGEADTIPSNYCFNRLFQESADPDATHALTGISSGFLPASNLKKGCYYYMFNQCKSLKGAAPKLDAQILTNCDSCYSAMFMNTGIETPSALPSTSLSNYCYRAMYYECYSLTSTPELNATVPFVGCYYMMFQRCSALQQIGYIHLETLLDSSCFQMFIGTMRTFNTDEGTEIFVCPSLDGLKQPVLRMFTYWSTDVDPVEGDTWYY